MKILHISDTHCGMRNGFAAPDTMVTFDDGKQESIGGLSSWSEWLWNKAYPPIIQTAGEFAGNDQLLVFHTGDVVHGEKHVGKEYNYSSFLDQQVEIAVEALKRLREIPQLAGFVFIYGTAAHDYGQQQGTKAVAAEMAKFGYPVECVGWFDAVIDGVRVNAIHHGPGIGKTDKAGPARAYITKLSRADLERGRQNVGLVMSGHVHQRLTEPVYFQWGDGFKKSFMSIAPPMTGPNEYAVTYTSRQALPYIECGATLLDLDGEVKSAYPVTVEQDHRAKIEIRAYNSGRYCQGDGQSG